MAKASPDTARALELRCRFIVGAAACDKDEALLIARHIRSAAKANVWGLSAAIAPGVARLRTRRRTREAG